ncbi:MAG: glycosyltransferase family 2 protein [Limisphaerales bacterium]
MTSTGTDIYFRRFGFCGPQIATRPAADLGIVVVMPCFNEPDLIGSLESLWNCDRPGCAVEALVVINSPADCAEAIRVQNQKTLAHAAPWIEAHVDPRLRFHPIHFPALPPKQAGVGLARKIGMDEAVRRFDAVNRPDGIVASFDADCRCAPNYLQSLERHFATHPGTPGCSIYFEHPLDGPLGPEVYEAIVAYELHLRYYVQALRYAGLPFAHHTIGSCMAVRAEVYRKQGGMNKRQAGEDFYFLQKIFPLGGFTDLTETRVFPSSRSSERVPFGTGRAVRDCLGGHGITTYPLEAFLDLKDLLDQLPALYRNDTAAEGLQRKSLPESLQTFLASQGFAEALLEVRENTSSEAAFQKRFFRWLNGFRVLKYIHHACDNFYGERKVDDEPQKLLERLPGAGPGANAGSIRDLLEVFRGLDRRPASGGSGGNQCR